jgi:hypothetical protein
MDLFFLAEKFLEKLFRLLESLFPQDHGLSLSPWVANESLFMKPVHGFPSKSLPCPGRISVLPSDEIEKGKAVNSNRNIQNRGWGVKANGAFEE